MLGGLWYFAVQNMDKDKWVSCAVFAFAAVAGIAFVNVMQRFRMAFNAYIQNLNALDGDLKVSIHKTGGPSTISTVQILLWTSVVVSLAGFAYVAHK